jgi:hypothetical protein
MLTSINSYVTRTLLLQFDVDNKKRTLVPGSFVRIALTINTPPRIEVPVETLIYRSGEPFVAVITEKNSIAFHKVAIAFSDGKTARLLSGAEEGEHVAMNLGAGVQEGRRTGASHTCQGKVKYLFLCFRLSLASSKPAFTMFGY